MNIHCWFVVSETSQMSLAMSTLLRQSRSHTYYIFTMKSSKVGNDFSCIALPNPLNATLYVSCTFLYSYPDLKPLHVLNAHPANCICIKFDPTGKYFATGSADALVSLWDVQEFVCVRTFSR